jgi:general secretion pathway protein D
MLRIRILVLALCASAGWLLAQGQGNQPQQNQTQQNPPRQNGAGAPAGQQATPVQPQPAPLQQVQPAQAPAGQPQLGQNAPAQAAPAPAAAAQGQPAQTQPAQAPLPSVPIGNLSLQNASLVEVIDQLARQLHINYILDPAVKGGVIMNTYGTTANLDARNLLELILRINGAAMVQEGDIFRIVPMKDAPKMPLRPQVNPRDIPEDEQIMLNLVFLKYVTVDELSKILGEFAGENASMYSYAPANLLFILDSRRNMRRTMELISLFDSDTFANQRVRLFEVQNTRPSDIVKDLESVLKAVSLDGKASTVRFLPIDRINTIIAVAPNPGVFDTVAEWLKKLDVPLKIAPGASSENHVYRLRYGRAECIALALNQLYGIGGYPGGYGGYPGYGFGGGFGFPGGYGMPGGAGYGFPNTFAASSYAAGGIGTGINNYASANSFNSGFGGFGDCQFFAGGYGMGGYGYGAYGGYGYPVFGGYAAQTPANQTGTGLLGGAPAGSAGPAPAGGAAGTTNQQGLASSGKPPVRVVANPLDNALIIQADAEQYQSILRILKDLDIPPRQILLEAKIYSVDLTGSFASGISAVLQRKSGTDKGLLGALTNQGVAAVQAGALVGQAKELLAFLNLSENQSRARVLSEPSLIATDSIPATITVGTQVPVQTSSSTTVAGSSTVTNTISSHNTGVTLQVNARVNPSGVVTLIINQEVSKPGAGADTLTPSFDQQVVQTQITVQDGDTIAIGGIISDTNTNSTTGIPGLIHVPGLNFLFGNKSISRARTELIIFMTPHVIMDETDLIEASNELKDRVRKLQKYVKAL